MHDLRDAGTIVVRMRAVSEGRLVRLQLSSHDIGYQEVRCPPHPLLLRYWGSISSNYDGYEPFCVS